MLEETLEIITGGTLFVLVFAMIIFGQRALTGFTIKISERYKPGSWYNKPEKDYKWRCKTVGELWTGVLFLIGIWCGILYVYPFMMSLYHKLGIL